MANLDREPLRQKLAAPTLLTVVPIVASTLEGCAQQWREAAASGAHIVEWRLDQLDESQVDEGAVEALALQMRNEVALPVLATWRTAEEGGGLDLGGRETTYLDRVRAGAKWADLADVEIDRPAAGSLIEELAGNVLVVASHHRFDPPVDGAHLRAKLEQMVETDAAVAKVASMVGSESDRREILAVQDWAGDLRTPAVVIGMGAAGQETRLGRRALSSAFAFATVNGLSAPGQPTLRELKESVAALD